MRFLIALFWETDAIEGKILKKEEAMKNIKM